MDDESYKQVARSILEATMSQMQTSFARDEIQYEIDYLFTSKDMTSEQLTSVVNEYHNQLPWYSRLALKIHLTTAPPRIRAFQQELSDRLSQTSAA